MILVDLKCPKCGKVFEDCRIDLKDSINCVCGERMERVFSPVKYRVIKYSPEYSGGSDKNLVNVPDGLGKREERK